MAPRQRLTGNSSHAHSSPSLDEFSSSSDHAAEAIRRPLLLAAGTVTTDPDGSSTDAPPVSSSSSSSSTSSSDDSDAAVVSCIRDHRDANGAALQLEAAADEAREDHDLFNLVALVSASRTNFINQCPFSPSLLF